MKKFLVFAFWIVSSVFSPPLYAQENGGRVILDLKEDEVPGEKLNYRHLQEYMEDVKTYDAAYPGEKIEEDFIDELRLRYPDDTFKGAAFREQLIRYGVRGMRIYKSLKSEFQKFMLENDIPLWVADEDYEDGSMPAYRPTDKPLVIQDFKKVIAYSPKDRKAAQAKEAELAGEETYTEKVRAIKQAVLKGDWKTVFSYGLFDGKPVEDMRGIGAWGGKAGQLRARLVSAVKDTGNNKEIRGALQLFIPAEKFLLSKDFQDYKAIKTDFSESDNVSRLTLNWPLPRRLYLNENQALSGYIGTVFVPFTVEMQESEKPLVLKLKVSGSLCGLADCQSEELAADLELAAGGSAEKSKMASFLELADHQMPQETHPDLQLLHLVAEKMPEGGQVLRLEAEVSDTPASFNAFIEGAEQNEFAAPLVRIDGSKVIVRFRALDKNADYIGRQITVAAGSAADVSVRRTMRVEEASPFDTESGSLNLSLLWFAVLGGFLLNFMPCVFPVLSLKIMSFSNFGNKSVARIRSEFLFNILGIGSSFLVMIAALISLKILGRAVGWGMQFQNIYFLTVMIFVISAFLAHIWNILALRPVSALEKITEAGRGRKHLFDFLSGAFLVLLSIPCTAPYLGTVLGFALAGSAWDIAVLVGLTGLGLALPYILIAAVPELAASFPHPGRWMRIISWLNGSLLLLALLWLLSVLSAQTSLTVFGHFVLFILGFWLLLWLRKLFMQALEEQEKDAVMFKKISRFFNVISAVLLLMLISWAVYDASSAYQAKQADTASAESTAIDMPFIRNEIRQGRSVLVKVGADWCLTCQYNDFSVFSTESIKEMFSDSEITVLEVDWTSFDASVLEFMEKFGRRGIPFYVIFTPRIPEGMVLPEIVSDAGMRNLVDKLRY